MNRILIADDHAVTREGLKKILAEEFPQAEFRYSDSIKETLKLLREDHLDLLVLDPFMSDGNGLGVLRAVRLLNRRIPVLVLSSATEEQLGLTALHAGASGYLDKRASLETVAQAARKILAGGKYVSETMAEQLAGDSSNGSRPPHEKLSAREFQILHLVVGGWCLKKIAADLSLSVKTVRTYRSRLLDKLHLESDVDLVHYSLDHHLIEKHISPPVSEGEIDATDSD